MILTDSKSAFFGSSPVKTIANFSSTSNQFMVYLDTTISRPITGTGVGVVKNGFGTLTLSAINTYTGNTTISAGTLSIINTSALPNYNTNGKFYVAPNATLAVYNAVTDAEITTLRNTTNFASSANLGFDTSSGNRTYTPLLSNTSQGVLGIVKLGANTLTLTATNTYTGPTNILAGTLTTGTTNVIPDSSPVNIASGAILNLGGAETIATLSGAGTLNTSSQLLFNSNNNATFTGVISSNYTPATNAAAVYRLGTGTQTFSGATVLFGDPNSGTTNCVLRQDSGGISVLGGSFIQTLVGTGQNAPRNYQMCVGGGTGTLTVAQSAVFTNKGLMLGDNGVGCNCTVNVSSGGSFINNGETWFSGSSGTMNIDAGTYSSGLAFEIGAGTASAINNVNITNGGTLIMKHSTFNFGRVSSSVNTLNISSGSILSAGLINAISGTNVNSNTVTFNNGTYFAAYDSITNLASSFLTYKVKSGGAIFNVPSGWTNTFNPNLLQDATSTGGGLVKTGAGQLTFGGTASTYTGQLSVLEGTFSVVSVNNNSANGVAGNSTRPIVLGSDGKQATLQTTATFTTNKNIIIPSNSVGIFNPTAGNITTSGNITGEGSLVKNGAGGFIINGNNTYSGGTTLNAGAIVVNSDTAFGTGTVVLSGANLRSQSGVSALSRTITNEIILDANTTFVNSTNEKTLVLAGPITITASRTHTVNIGASVASESLTISGPIGDNGNGYGITKAGSGNLVLSGQNTYSGNTTLNAGFTRFKYVPIGEIRFTATGVLQFDSEVTTDVSSRILNNTAAVRVDTNGQNGTFASLLSSNSGGLVKTGTGTLTLSTTPIGTNPNGIRGTIYSNAGELTFTGTLSTVSSIFASSGAGTSGTLSISGAVIQTAGNSPRNFQIAPTVGTTGIANIYSGGILRNSATGGIMLGENNGGTGIMNIYGGTVDIGGGNFYFAGPTATLSMSAGTLNTGAMYLAGGTGATSSFTINGGTATPSILFFGQGVGIGTLNLNGGLVSTGYLGFVSLSAHVVNFNGGTLRTSTNGAIIPATAITNIGTGGCFYDQSANTGSIYSVLSSQGNDGGLTKLGAGTLQLSAINVYTGTTAISAGTLRVLKKISGTGTDASFNQANFALSTLSVTFNSNPNVGDTYKMFPTSTVNSYSSITLVGTTGRTATYNSSNSTLTIA